MRYLLDTNALIGFLFKPEFLSSSALYLLENSDNLYVSIISLWEIGIKQSINKIDIHADSAVIAQACRNSNISMIHIRPEEIDEMKSLPQFHKDPFDRLLIAQAKLNSMTIITKDSIIPQYPGIQTYW